MSGRFAGTSIVLTRLGLPALFLALVLISTAAIAENYPSRPIHIIVPYAAGGAIDVTARILAERLAPLLGQPMIIENRPGAAGMIAAAFVSRAEPDGYTILYTAGADLAILQGRPSTADGIRKLTPIASAVSPVGAIAIRPGLEADSIEKLLAYIKANPGNLTFGSTGFGSSQHLTGEYLKQSGYEMLHVPYTGMGPVMTALAGGQIDVALANFASSLPLTGDGRIKIVAVPQSERYEDAPEIPPITQAMPDFVFRRPISFYGYYGPPGLPHPIATRLANEIAKAVLAPETKIRLKALFIAPTLTSPDEFAAMAQEAGATFEKIIKIGNINLK
jgi:tripartite-type tricarboxylate transporter receptor subunit TctC